MSQAGKFILGTGGAPVETLTGDTGGAVGPDAAGNIGVPGTHGINTTGDPAANTMTFAIDNTITLGDLAAVVGDALTLTTGDETITAGDLNITAGNINLPTSNAAATEGIINFASTRVVTSFPVDQNMFFGALSGNLAVTGTFNNGMGGNSLAVVTTGLANNAMGFNALALLTTGDRNLGIGGGALSSLDSGDYNVALGETAGSNYTGSESSNINIMSSGTLGESNTLNIGVATGTGNRELNASYIQGIYQRTPSGTSEPVIVDENGQLGSATLNNGEILIGSTSNSPSVSTLTAGTNVTISNGPGTITISASATPIFSYTAVNTTPYNVVETEYFLGVDSSGAPIQVNLPNNPATGETWVVKDSTGSAASQNITVTTAGGVVTIDGATTFVMNTAYESVNVIFNGTSYEVF